MRTNLSGDERQATLDAISRFKVNDPELKKEYDIEFVITGVIPPSWETDLISFLKGNKISYKKVIRNESDIYVIIPMGMEENKIIEIEEYLTFFANDHLLKYDGWGAFE